MPFRDYQHVSIRLRWLDSVKQSTLPWEESPFHLFMNNHCGLCMGICVYRIRILLSTTLVFQAGTSLAMQCIENSPSSHVCLPASQPGLNLGHFSRRVSNTHAYTARPPLDAHSSLQARIPGVCSHHTSRYRNRCRPKVLAPRYRTKAHTRTDKQALHSARPQRPDIPRIVHPEFEHILLLSRYPFVLERPFGRREPVFRSRPGPRTRRAAFSRTPVGRCAVPAP